MRVVARWPLSWSAADRTALAAIVMVISLFASPLSTGQTLSTIEADLAGHFPWAAEDPAKTTLEQPDVPTLDADYPISVFGTNSLRSGRFPTWSPFSLAGLPVAELGVGGVMYPPRIVAMLLLDPPRQHDWIVLGHAAVSGLATYAFIRIIGVRAMGAALGGLTWALAPAVAQGATHEGPAIAAAWLAVGLASATLAVKKRSPTWAVSAGVAMGLNLLSGAGVYAATTDLVVAGWYLSLLVSAHVRRDPRLVLLLTSSVLVAVGLGAAVWMPILEGLMWANLQPTALGNASPQQGDWSAVLQIVLHPERVAGDTRVLDTLARTTFFGQPALALAAVGLAVVLRGRRMAVATILLATCLAAGWKLLEAEQGARVIGGFTALGLLDLRLWLFWVAFAIAVFAGLGLSWLLERAPRDLGRLAIQCGLALVAVQTGQLLTYDWALHPGEPMASGGWYPTSPLLVTVQNLAQDQRVLTVAPMFDGETPAAVDLPSLTGRDSWLPAHASVIAGNVFVPRPGSPAVPGAARLNLAFLERLSVGLVAVAPGVLPLDEAGQDTVSTGRLRLIYRGDDGWVFQDARALPRVFVANQFVSVPDAQTAMQILLKPNFDAHDTAVITGPLPARATGVLSERLLDVTLGPLLQTSGTATVQWHVPSDTPGEVWVAQDSQAETLLARSARGSETVDWISPGSTYTFHLYADSQRSTLLATRTVSAGDLAEAPETDPATVVGIKVIRDPLDSTRASVVWHVPDDAPGEVWVAQDAEPETLMARGGRGLQEVNWIAPASSYVFSLYVGPDKSRLVGAQTIVASAEEDTQGSTAGKQAVLRVNPNPVPMGSGHAVITWQVPGDQPGEVWVAQDDKPEALMARGKSGSQPVDWIAAGSTFVFRLYAGSDRQTVLAETRVERGRAAAQINAELPQLEPVSSPDASPEAAVTSEDLDRVDVDVDAAVASIAVLNDTWYPGWQVGVDGVDEPLLRTNYAFRGVAVPPGKHHITFLYRPVVFYIGLGLSLLSATLVFLFATLRIAGAARRHT